MDEYHVWPLSYSGLPALLSSLALVLITSSLLAVIMRAELYFLALFSVGIVMNLVACGKRVIIRDDCVVLEYGFPKPILKYAVRDIVEVFDINELSRGRLVKYFKVLLVPFTLVMILPVAYVVTRGVYPNPAYVPLIVIPVAIGVFLLLYMMFTAPSYGKFLRRAAAVTATVSTSVMAFMIGYFYRDVYGRSIFSNPSDAAVGIAGTLMLVLLAAAIALFAGRNHVVILVDAVGRYYAVGTAGAEAAREFMSAVLKVMRKGRGGFVDGDA